MSRIIPPSRPKRDNAIIDAIIERYAMDPSRANLIFVRGWYLDSMGKPGVDDANIYDDAAFLVSPNIRESYNANTGPSFPQKGYAKLDLGLYTFYPSFHHIANAAKRYKALRPYPEGVVLKCTRNGKPGKCSHTNCHKGGSNPASFDVVWSEGCLTIPSTQYPDWQPRVWGEIVKYNGLYVGSKTANGKESPLIDLVIVENRSTDHGQRLFDHLGRMI